MTVQAAAASSLQEEFFVARNARSKKSVEESFGERLARLRKALDVSVEELLGLKPVPDKPAPHNTQLWRKLREIEKLPVSDRRAVIKLVDGLLVRQKLNSRRTRR